MSLKKSLLFYGELPPKSIHGIACSNMINLKLLKRDFEITILEEKSSLSKKSSLIFNKLFRNLKDDYLILKKTLKEKFDFFYLTFSISFMGGMKTLFAIICFRLFSKGKVILHIHRGDFITWFNNNLPNKLLTHLVIGLSGKIIVLSEVQKIKFMEFFDKPVFVLHNTVESEFDYSLRKKGNTQFIYISNYLIEKGIFDLLEVFQKLLIKYPDITLHTYGAFPSPDIKEKVMRFNNRHISIGGVITGNEKFSEILKADCLILPSFNEGEPIILLEAMSLGTPIISTKVGLIPELLGEDYPFLALPGNKASLEEKIIQFIGHKNLIFISEYLKNRYTLMYSQKAHSEDLFGIFN